MTAVVLCALFLPAHAGMGGGMGGGGMGGGPDGAGAAGGAGGLGDMAGPGGSMAGAGPSGRDIGRMTGQSEHDLALSVRQQGLAEALERTIRRLEKQHGGKVLDVKIVREQGRMAYRIRLLDARNRLLKVDVPLRPVRRTNFGPRRR